MRALAATALLAIAALGGCDKPYDNGYAVDIIVSGDGSVPDATLQTAATLEFDVGGAESATTTYTLDHPFAGGEERVIYRPLVPGGMLTVTVTARDATGVTVAAGSAPATLDPGKTVTLRVHIGKGGGDGGMPSNTLVVDRTSFNFGTYVSGQTATPHTFTVLNDSAMPSGTLTTSITGVDLGAYSLESDGCAGHALGPGASCTLSVRLKTDDVGTPTASLVVSADPPGMATVVLSGTIVSPGLLSLAPSAGDFGSVAQGQSSGQTVFTVLNTSDAASGMLGVTVDGDDGVLFDTPNGCAGTALGPGSTCSIMISFSPGTAALGYKSATLVVTGMPGGTATAELRGTVIMPGSIGISPGFYDLGKVSVGQTSPTQVFTVTNTGAQPTGVLSKTASGNPDQFEIVSDACVGQALPAMGSCEISVRFKPTAAATSTLVLAVSASPGGTVPATAVGIGGDFVTLTITKIGTAGAVSAPGVSCGADCTELYDRNTMVTVNAIPDPTSRFGTWTGAAPCAGTKASTCTLTMDSDKSLDASFIARPAANYMFITSTTVIPMTLGAGGADPLAAADAICKTRAVQGGLPGVFKAFLGTTTVAPISRLGTASGWIRTDDLPFAASLASLGQAKILYPPRIDESGVAVADDPQNMTGTGDAATASNFLGAFLGPNCADWTAAGMYVFGYAAGTAGNWASINNMRDCGAPAHLYCFETTRTTGVTVTGPTTFRRAFLTQGTYNPPSSGIAGADNVCNTEKTTYGVTTGGSGVFRAMLAPSGALASSRFTITAGTAPWVRPDGVQLATTAAALFTDSLLAGVNVTANGTYVPPNDPTPVVLIGSANGITQNGADNQNCTNWTSTGGGAYGGRATFADKNWSIGDTSGCVPAGPPNNQNRYLCLEQ